MSSIINKENFRKTIELLKKGSIGVIPTDTIYGISCLALNKILVEKVYEIKERAKEKPFIILISEIEDLEKFDVDYQQHEDKLAKYWPGKVSIILPCENPKLDFLTKGKKSLAFRLPDKLFLKEIIKETGPLISTSVNKAGETPAKTIKEAIEVTNGKLDFYLDFGPLNSNPSKVILIENGKETVIRE